MTSCHFIILLAILIVVVGKLCFDRSFRVLCEMAGWFRKLPRWVCHLFLWDEQAIMKGLEEFGARISGNRFSQPPVMGGGEKAEHPARLEPSDRRKAACFGMASFPHPLGANPPLLLIGAVRTIRPQPYRELFALGLSITELLDEKRRWRKSIAKENIARAVDTRDG